MLDSPRCPSIHALGLAAFLLAGPAAAEATHPRAIAAEAPGAHPKISANLLPEAVAPALRGPGQRPDAPAAETVALRASAIDDELIAAIEQSGARIVHSSRRHARMTLAVDDRSVLSALAELPGVEAIERQWPPIRRVGAVTSRAVSAQNVEPVSTMGPMLDGEGQTLGILSDSFARTGDTRTMNTMPGPCVSATEGPVGLTGLANQDSVDLPGEVALFADDAESGACPGAGTLIDEGAAMAELAYDIAPGIDIAFHTAFISPASFADGIDRLCDPVDQGGAGASIVVDDVLFPSELMYQHDIIAQAAARCVERGVAYFSSAGNAADRAFREDYTDVDGAGSADFGDDFHDWGGGSGVIEIQMDAGESFTAALQWNQPALSLQDDEFTRRGPEIDLDLYLFDDASADADDVVAASPRDQQAEDSTAGMDPWEIISFTAPGAGSFYLAVDHFAGSQTGIPQDPETPLEFRLVFFGSEQVTIEGIDGAGGAGAPSVYGHPVGPGVIAVGAVPWWTTPAFDPTAADSPTADIDPQAFSALGGELPISFDARGRFVGESTPLQPRIAAVDASNNTFFGITDVPTMQGGEDDSFPNFFGTSAAAPNAAAVGLLLQEYAGGLGGLAVDRLLTGSAVDVTGERAATGPDAVSGFGLVDAEAAVGRFPVAVAGLDRRVDAGTTVELDAGESSAGRETIESFAWTQTDGPEVELAGADSDTASFAAPGEAGVELAFEVAITDSADRSDSDTVTLTTQRRALIDFDEARKSGSGGNSSCFIATAAWGSPLAAEVGHLRDLRDGLLSRHALGRAFTVAYYRLSPPVADALRRHDGARAVVRFALAPLVMAAAHPLPATLVLLVLLAIPVARVRGLVGWLRVSGT